jgi:hypothetical protein
VSAAIACVGELRAVGRPCRIDLERRIVRDLHGVPPTGAVHRSPSAVNAIVRPSGETAGRTADHLLRPGWLERAVRDRNVVRCRGTVALNGTTEVVPSSDCA